MQDMLISFLSENGVYTSHDVYTHIYAYICHIHTWATGNFFFIATCLNIEKTIATFLVIQANSKTPKIAELSRNSENGDIGHMHRKPSYMYQVTVSPESTVANTQPRHQCNSNTAPAHALIAHNSIS